jgi:hypothetical protein
MFCLRYPAVLKNPTDLAPIHSIYQSFTEAQEDLNSILKRLLEAEIAEESDLPCKAIALYAQKFILIVQKKLV